jgi:hypothetical protein
MKSTMETYKGKNIFFAHYDHLSLDELHAEVASVKQELTSRATEMPLVLVDITGTLISPEVLNLFKDMASFGGEHHSKTAVLGITGVRRTILEIIKNFSKTTPVPFDDVISAKEWLIN